MGEIIVKHIIDEIVDDCIESLFTIDGKEITGQVDLISLNPLRFLEYDLVKKGIKTEKPIVVSDPWNIEELRIKYKEPDEIERLLKEIMEYRCHPAYDLDWHYIIRQLPFEVLMETSDAIMNYGKSAEDIAIDKYNSNRRWKEIANNVRTEWGEEFARTYENGNPNGTIDELTIPEDDPKKRLHLIYRSSRGGYNIKTQTYEDSSLDHYCFYDSHEWD